MAQTPPANRELARAALQCGPRSAQKHVQAYCNDMLVGSAVHAGAGADFATVAGGKDCLICSGNKPGSPTPSDGTVTYIRIKKPKLG